MAKPSGTGLGSPGATPHKPPLSAGHHLNQSNTMSTVRPGNQPTLVVVDVQVGVMAESWESARVISNIARAVQRAREGGVPVVWIQDESDELPRDSASWQLVPELVPTSADCRVYKRFASSFEETNLEDVLRQLGTTHIVLAGAQTNWCIRATAYAALERGYDLTLLQDAHTTSGIDLGQGSKVEASGIVADLNVAMKWLSYPGRKSAVARAEEVEFGVASRLAPF
ncbi:MAG: isochorismatase family protein [Betaproteobacteria bacterium]|nr:isochorismatase family protein [Betaproteobacteria bacterium]